MITWIERLPEKPNTDWEYIEMVHRGEPWLYRSPLASFTFKYKGYEWVNGYWVLRWIRYGDNFRRER